MSTTKPPPPTPPTPPPPPRPRRLERSTNPPPPRRKSCLACVRAKRRCDQRLPACVRCAQRRIPCERVVQYGQHSSRLFSGDPQESSSLPPPPPPPPVLPPDPEPMEVTLSPGQMGRDVGVGQGVMMNVAVGEDIDMTFLEGPWDDDGDCEDGRFGDGLFEFVAEPSLGAQPVDSMHWTTDLGGVTAFEEEASGSFFSSQTPRAKTASASTDVLIRPPLELANSRSLNVEEVSRLLENNLSYAVGKIKSAPQQMLLELETPWCHALLYKDKMPRVMQGDQHSHFLALLYNI